MAIKLADSCVPMASGYPVAEAQYIDFSDGESLQKKLDDGSLGGDSSWTGTHAEWESLLASEKAKYTTVYFTDDTDSTIIDDTTASTDKVYSSEKIKKMLGLDLHWTIGNYQDVTWKQVANYMKIHYKEIPDFTSPRKFIFKTPYLAKRNAGYCMIIGFCINLDTGDSNNGFIFYDSISSGTDIEFAEDTDLLSTQWASSPMTVGIYGKFAYCPNGIDDYI